MLCPEVWDFEAPKHKFSINEINCESYSSVVIDTINKHYFNHSVSVILADDDNDFLDGLQKSVLEDTDYYLVRNTRIVDLIHVDFIQGFVKEGESSVLTIEKRIDLDNVIALTPTGQLILSLLTEDYQTLGLEGQESFFDRKSNTRYVTTIDLKAQDFIPGKNKYERVRHCLENFNETFDIVVAWDPFDERLCPSSIAAWFHNRGYTVQLCHQKFSEIIERSLPVPSIADGYRNDKFFEWIGVFSIAGDLKRKVSNDGNDFVNNYRCPSPHVFVDKVQCYRCTGFFTRRQIKRLYEAFNEHAIANKVAPWAGLHVQGFMDSPVNLGLQEHTFFTDGDNSYTIVLKPPSKCIVRKSLSCNKKNRIS